MHDNFNDCNQPVKVCELNEYHRNGSCMECPGGRTAMALHAAIATLVISVLEIVFDAMQRRSLWHKDKQQNFRNVCMPKVRAWKVAAEIGQDACHNVCPNGKYATDHEGAASQQEACKDCEKGSYCMFGSAFLCPRGKYNNESGSVDMNACKHCGAGRYNDKSGANSTLECKSCGFTDTGIALSTESDEATSEYECQKSECAPNSAPVNILVANASNALLEKRGNSRKHTVRSVV